MQARLALMAVNFKPLVSLTRPGVTCDVPLVLNFARPHATLHSLSPLPLALVTSLPVSTILPALASS